MAVIPVALAGRSYEVRVGSGLLRDLAAQCGPLLRKTRVPIVTDHNVHRLWGGAVEEALRAADSRDGLALKFRLSEGGSGEHDPYADFSANSAPASITHGF